MLPQDNANKAFRLVRGIYTIRIYLVLALFIQAFRLILLQVYFGRLQSFECLQLIFRLPLDVECVPIGALNTSLMPDAF
jgi:hypothetical protein